MAIRPSSSSSSATATNVADVDLEQQQSKDTKSSHFSVILDQAGVTQAVIQHPYNGNGTEESPYVVEFLPNDPREPVAFSRTYKWTITLLQAFAMLAVTFVSSAYSGGLVEIVKYFHVSDEVATLGISLFVLGFAIGPLFWAPLSELYGRQKIFFITYMIMTILNAVAAGVSNIAGLIVIRFLAGSFGASCLTNAGGVIADLFSAAERGFATSVFAMAPFLGPAIGPIAGGFLGEAEGWRWLHGLMAIFTGTLWILITLIVPETYAPVLLRVRAEALSRKTGKVYISKLDVGQPKKTIGQQFKIALSRPWILLFKEPIVLLLSIYIAIIYGTLYLCFAAFPIVFQVGRGWSPGIGGLSFVGVAVGVIIATFAGIYDNKRYQQVAAKHGGAAPPETRLPQALVGSVMIPVGLFWFAWTNGPSVHWVVPIIGSAFFSFGLVLVFLSLLNYLIDSYVIFAASVLAANSVIRSVFGAAFPLFTKKMYENLGIHWASSIPAFLALACVPFPFLFAKYGETIRMKCEYAAEAARVLERMRTKHTVVTADEAVEEAEELWRERTQGSRAEHGPRREESPSKENPSKVE
ncbi:hypothetical protein NM208_g922 [Fusarium decemcellulare]|uniref:Uncharacterized protein n=1 Tax=Fusarium decemcellulare TaxID=57161 RepID=A0ACC1SXW7_9HYPO|nr:hypothetical protein NM208_g922 [Fusarium decemcellulare]